MKITPRANIDYLVITAATENDSEPLFDARMESRIDETESNATIKFSNFKLEDIFKEFSLNPNDLIKEGKLATDDLSVEEIYNLLLAQNLNILYANLSDEQTTAVHYFSLSDKFLTECFTAFSLEEFVKKFKKFTKDGKYEFKSEITESDMASI